MKTLLVNADDFGFTRGVNEGIVRAHREGIVTATTLMADAEAFEHAVELARATPTLDVGVHLVLWPGDERLPQPWSAFAKRAWKMTDREIERDFCRQVEKVTAAGLDPSHLDTHKHVHLFPKVMRAVVRVAARFGIRWVRRPIHARQVTAHGLRTADHFMGVRLTGRLDRSRLLAGLRRLRPGVTELMCHPGLCDEELERAATRLKRQRQIEVEALAAPETRSELRRLGIHLVSFRAMNVGARLVAPAEEMLGS